MRILVVEDDQVSQRVLAAIVSKIAECDVASNGEEAYEKFCDACEQDDPFDLIFLDVMMPEVSGQEALVAIRDYEEQLGIAMGQGVKVIMTTALDDGNNLYQAHANGCVDYIVKPISRDKIINSIKKLGLMNSGELADVRIEESDLQ